MRKKWNELSDKRKDQIKVTQSKYVRKTFATFLLRLRRDEDADLIELVESASNKNAFLRSAIRAGIAKEKVGATK